MSETSVVTEALREEAKHWNRLAKPLTDLADEIGQLHLSGTAFAVGSVVVDSVASDMQKTYEKFRNDLVTSTLKGSEQFDEIAIVLRKIADMYDNNEGVNAKSLRDIYSD